MQLCLSDNFIAKIRNESLLHGYLYDQRANISNRFTLHCISEKNFLFWFRLWGRMLKLRGWAECTKVQACISSTYLGISLIFTDILVIIE